MNKTAQKEQGKGKQAKEKLVGVNYLDELGNIKHFEKLEDGWVRWNLVGRDFLPFVGDQPWEAGKTKCSAVGGRLGLVREHRALFDAFDINPNIKETFFPNDPTGWYWTEEVAGDPSIARVVSFNGGTVGNFSKDLGIYVRPVRVSQ